MRKTIYKWTRKLHKWAGLLLVVQILLWMLGGLVMSAIPLEKVHGKHLATKSLATKLIASDYSYSLDSIIANNALNPSRIEFSNVLNTPYYFIFQNSVVMAFNATNGELMQGLKQAEVLQIANGHYLGNAEQLTVELLTIIPDEAARNSSPVWQVVFDDLWNTTLYIANATGKVTTIRSDIWRIFDFVWMLHIMDYDNREDFNNPLLISFAAASLLFTLSGFVMLYYGFVVNRRKRR